MYLCFLMTSHSARKRKNKYYPVLKRRRCCLLLRLDKAWLVWSMEKSAYLECFHILQGNYSLFPTAAAASSAVLVGAKGGEKQMKKTDKRRALLILVLKHIKETCEGPAHQEGRFPPTPLHAGQLSEHTTQRVRRKITQPRNSQGLCWKRGEGTEEERRSVWGRWMAAKATVCWEALDHGHCARTRQESQAINLHGAHRHYRRESVEDLSHCWTLPWFR